MVSKKAHFHSKWGDGALICLSALQGDRVGAAISDMNTVARAWLNSHPQTWKKMWK